MEASLRRLDLPYVDIVYAHCPDRDTPMEEIVRAFNYLINTGKAFYWGTSSWAASEIAEAMAIAERHHLIGPVVEQPQYNLFTREKVEKEFRPLYASFGLGLAVFSPLKHGILTGKYNNTEELPAQSRLVESNDLWTQNARESLVGNETWKQQLKQTAALTAIAKELGASTAQLALAWVLMNENVSSAIIGASRPGQIAENIGALSVIEKLTPEIVEKIELVVGNNPQ